jgi:hypothetical protein
MLASGSEIAIVLPVAAPPPGVTVLPTVPGASSQPSKATLASRETVDRMNRFCKIVRSMIASRVFVTTVVILMSARRPAYFQ